MISVRILATAAAAVLTAGCAVEAEHGRAVTTSSLKPRAEAVRKAEAADSGEKLKAFCRQRHLDHQTGKLPGGATSLEQKQADDRRCSEAGY